MIKKSSTYFFLITLVLFSSILFNSFLVIAGSIPKEPILRLNTGMHTAPIRRIGIDTKARFLVTGSDDKTIRVFDLLNGKQLKILRPPIGTGFEGMLDAVAISPDANLIASGGSTGYKWDNQICIYIFDRKSGELIHRILTGLPGNIKHLAFSKDGRYIAAALGQKGLRVYEVGSFALIAKDINYGALSNWVDFDNQGRLVTSCYDGFIRLYDDKFMLISKRKSAGGKQPRTVTFSPDGSKIAVGHRGNTNIEILSGRDLTLLYTPDTRGIANGNLVSVSWSADSRFLYAGGSYRKNNGFTQIIKWANAGQGSYNKLTASGFTITEILPLPSGGIVFGATDPAWGIFNDYDIRTLYNDSSIINFRDMLRGFLLSRDGSKVAFSYEFKSRSPLLFSIPDRSLFDKKHDDPSLKPPKLISHGMKITGWKNTKYPKINNKPLKISQHEYSRSLSIMPDQSGLLIGGDWSLRFFDRNGQKKWITIPGSTVWAVNIAQNMKVCIAALGDGTIRWYRMSDGKELLALFTHKDRKRWVVWTPTGYYDASPNAEDLIGWHVNREKDQVADFFPISRFRYTLYRPDVIGKVLTTLSEEKALRQANGESKRGQQLTNVIKLLPPVVKIISPFDGDEVSTNKIIIKFSIHSVNNEPVHRVRVLIDGRPVSKKRGFVIKQKTFNQGVHEIYVKIPERDVEIGIIAENRHASSVPAKVRLVWRGKTKKDKGSHSLYILAVGVSDYVDDNLDLRYAAKDAQDFVRIMKKQYDIVYPHIGLRLLINGNAIKDKILNGLKWIEQKTSENDVVIIFLAGHAINDITGNYYFLPSDTVVEKIRHSGLFYAELKKTLSVLTGKILFFVDTCHSGNVMGDRGKRADMNFLVNDMSSPENGVVVFASSMGNQYALENDAWQNGAFTKALLEGLSGKADFMGSGQITILKLAAYIAERVSQLTGGRQTPAFALPVTIPDFSVAIAQ